MAGMRSGFFLGLAVGVGAAVIGPLAWRTGRPAAKAALRTGLEGYVAARGAAAHFAEEVEDLVAEVKHEMQDMAAGATQGAGEERAEEVAIHVVNGGSGASSHG